MRKIFMTMILILACGSSIAQIQSTVRFNTDSLKIENRVIEDVTYSKLFWRDFFHDDNPGNPEMLYKSMTFIIPFGFQLDSVSIIDTLFTEMILDHNIIPVQAANPTCSGCPAPPFIHDTASVYSTDQYYPNSITGNSKHSTFNNCRLLTLSVSPLQFNPKTKSLLIYTSFTIVIYLKPDVNAIYNRDLKKLRNNAEQVENTIKGLILNKNDYNQYAQPVTLIDSIDNSNSSIDFYEYIVLSKENFKSTAEKLIEWKRKKGLDAGFVSIEDINTEQNYLPDDIGNNTYSNSKSIYDDTARVRMYLKDAFSHGAQWLLIVGDESIVPIRYQHNHHDLDDEFKPNDKYYANFTSDWAIDNDSYYGEYHDAVESGLELYVGRIPCTSPLQFDNWVNKLLLYETSPGKGDSSYLMNCYGIQSDYFQFIQEYQNHFQANTPFYAHTYAEETPDYNTSNCFAVTGPSGIDIINSYNQNNPYFWIWLEHGKYNWIQTMSSGDNQTTCPDGKIQAIDEFQTGAALDKLTNIEKPGIVFALSCSIAGFDEIYSGNHLTMAESYLVNNNTGGICVFGGTRIMGQLGGEILLEQFSNNLSAINSTKNEFLSHIGVNYFDVAKKFRDHYDLSEFFRHNLFGDPEARLFTRIPKRISATFEPRHIEVNEPTDIKIEMSNIGHNDSVYVALYGENLNNGNPLVQIVNGTGSITTVTFNELNVTATGPLYITISGFNYLPYTGEIIVAPICSYSTIAEEINSTPIFPWSNTRFKDHDVIINPGATLTITGKVYFVQNAKLIIKPGAKVLLNGGTLGSACENQWKGVELWGQNDKIQSTTYQGVIEIINNGTIEDAVCGIVTSKRINNEYDDHFTGGIIKCENAHFRNNKIGVSYHPYKYKKWLNLGSFENTEFKWDIDYILPEAPSASDYPIAMAKLDGINLLTFENTRFLNLMNTPLFNELRGTGINAYNANFRLFGSDSEPLVSHLEGFQYGIYATSSYPTMFKVEFTDFINNLRGVYLNLGQSVPSIYRNHFVTHASNPFLPSSAIYLNGTTSYFVQENEITGNYTNSDTYETGIILNNTGLTPNEIYNNTFTNLQNGITAQDNNLGLLCKCNDYTGVKNDQSVILSSGAPSTWGIALYQGDSLSVTGLAGNTFSQRSIGSGTYDLFNQGARFKYYHHANTPTKRLEPNPQLCTNVYLKQWIDYSYDKQTSCPTKLNNGGSGLEEMKIELQSTSTSVQQKETELQALIDGGTTEQTTEDIIYSIPPEALILRDELLTKSPYLSDTVMQSAVANEFVLPNVMIRDILVANPQSASSEPILDELDKRTEPMPEELYNQILDAELAYSPLEIREMELASLKSKQSWLLNSVVSYYMSDTAGSLCDSLNVVLQNAPSPDGRYLLALMQMEEKDTIAAALTLQAISTSFELNNEQQAILNDHLNYLEILQEMNRDSLPRTETDSSQTASLLALMVNAHEPVKSYIRNILISNKVITYEEPYLFADELKASRLRKPDPIKNVKDALLQISPNPAKGYFIVRYELSNYVVPATLEVVSLHGQRLLIKQLHKNTDQFVVPLTGFSPGIYIVSISVNDRVLDNCRLIVVK